tara:strand:+ start:90 stop:458 length:369 start_codon:yes stop_codon:yes gene_type:complete
MKIDDNILELAVTQAHKSPMHYRHGAVIWKGKDILGTGYNFPAAPPTMDKRRFSIHSERDCLKGLRGDKIFNAELLCVRVTPSGALSSSKPCRGCMKLLRRKGLKNVYWFNEEGKLKKTRLS